MDKISKLSQAIRLGATFRPQCRGDLFEGGRSCAIGAAVEALTGISNEPEFRRHGIIASELLWKRFRVDLDMQIAIAERNDRRGQTREQIADWLEAQGL